MFRCLDVYHKNREDPYGRLFKCLSLKYTSFL